MSNDNQQFGHALHQHDVRLTRVEAHLEAMDSRIVNMEKHLSDMKESVDHNAALAGEAVGELKGLKSAAQIFAWVFGTMLAMIGLAVSSMALS
jgi:hypothetical protein